MAFLLYWRSEYRRVGEESWFRGSVSRGGSTGKGVTTHEHGCVYWNPFSSVPVFQTDKIELGGSACIEEYGLVLEITRLNAAGVEVADQLVRLQR